MGALRSEGNYGATGIRASDYFRAQIVRTQLNSRATKCSLAPQRSAREMIGKEGNFDLKPELKPPLPGPLLRLSLGGEGTRHCALLKGSSILV